MITKEELQSLPVETRWNIARYGNDEERILLADDGEKFIRRMLAKYGSDEIRKLLVNDPDERVIRLIRTHGGEEVVTMMKKVQSL